MRPDPDQVAEFRKALAAHYGVMVGLERQRTGHQQRTYTRTKKGQLREVATVPESPADLRVQMSVASDRLQAATMALVPAVRSAAGMDAAALLRTFVALVRRSEIVTLTEFCKERDRIVAIVAEVAAKKPRTERDNDAVHQRQTERRSWILEVIGKHKRARSIQELRRWCVDDGRHPIDKDTLKRDLRAMLEAGELTADQAPPIGP